MNLDNIICTPENANLETALHNSNKWAKRRCSFCNKSGHTINRCFDSRFSVFKNFIFYIKDNINNMYNDDDINNSLMSNILLNLNENVQNCLNKIIKMEKFLYDYCKNSPDNNKMIRAFACRFCNCRIRSRIEVVINKILAFVFDLNFNQIINNPHNHILVSEITPIKISVVFNAILLNYIIYNDMLNNEPPINIQLNLSLILNENLEKQNEIIECSICYNEYKLVDCLTFNCNHNFCVNCSKDLIKNKHTKCPNCRCDIKEMNCYNNNNYNYIEKEVKQVLTPSSIM
jgi:hypothetical protein